MEQKEKAKAMKATKVYYNVTSGNPQVRKTLPDKHSRLELLINLILPTSWKSLIY